MLTRKEIIKALQNYSEEIGGKTPGEKNFYENTNVGIMDRKRYWSNYGELVKAARLTPNKFDKTKYSEEELCELFIKTIREQDKWPTRGVLDIKHYEDPTFPDSATFYKRLGNVKTGDLARKIIEYVKDKRGRKAIVDICQPFLKKTGEQVEVLPIDKGFVYLLKSTLRNRVAYKIGRTKDIENRRKQLRQPSNIERSASLYRNR